MKPVLIAALALVPLYAADSGEALYKQKCAGCHGPNGSGQTTMGKTFKLRDLRSPEVQGMSDEQLTNVIANGKGKMPAYKNSCTPDQVKTLVAHVRELAKTK